MAYFNDDPPPAWARPGQPSDPSDPTGPAQPMGPLPPTRRMSWGQPVQPIQQPMQPVEPVLASNGRRTYASRIIYLILGILETLLLLRFLLKLLGANPDAGFTSLIYGITYPFVVLFEDVFHTPQRRGSVLEFSTILAMIVYALLAWGIVKAIDIARNRRPTYTTS